MSSTYPTLFGCEAGGGGRVVIAGVPYDRGTDPHRAGCAAAPNTLRRLSSPEQTRMRRGGLYDFARRECIVDGALVSDLGDLPFRVGQNDDAYLALVTSAARVIALEAKKPLFLGGDHLITLSALRGLAQAGHKLQVVQLDAHHDYEPIETGESPTHATFVAHVMAEGLATQVLQIGVRGLGSGEPPAPAGVTTIQLAELPSALEPGVGVYVTVDTDAFDPTVACAVGYPEPAGLPLAALGQVLASIRDAGLDLVGADWTEFNPRFDTANGLTGRVVLTGLGWLMQCLVGTRTTALQRD